MLTSGLIRIASSLLRRVLRGAVGVAALLSISLCPHVVKGAEIYTGDPISLELVDAELVNVLTSLSSGTDFIFAVDAQTVALGGIDRLVTVDYQSVPWDRALDEILVAAGLEWTLEGKILWIHLPASVPAGDRNFTGDPIKLRLEDADLRKVLATMAKVTAMAIDLEPDIEGTVSINLKDIPWDQTLDFIFRINGLDYTRSGDAIRVFKVIDSKGMQLMPTSGMPAEGENG